MDGVREQSGESTNRFDAFAQAGISTPMAWMANYPNSYQGTNDYVLNERIAKAFTEWNIDYLAERFRFLKNETISEEYHAEWLAKQ